LICSFGGVKCRHLPARRVYSRMQSTITRPAVS